MQRKLRKNTWAINEYIQRRVTGKVFIDYCIESDF